jgi:hypothetical protein
MKSLLKIFLLIGAFSFSISKAQIITKKDTLNGTELSISANANITRLMKQMGENCKETTTKIIKTEEAPTHTEEKIIIPKRKNSTAEICRQNPRIMGYKILVATAKSNDEANKIKVDFRQNFPTLKVEVDASLRPNYKILAGSYFTKESARSDLRKIKTLFKTATSVQYSIFCVDGR